MGDITEKIVRGNLELQNLASVLLTIYLHRSSGDLIVQRDKVIKRLFFDEGNIIFAASNQSRDRLGDILLQEKQISQKEYDASVLELKKGKKRQGAILVQLGCLTTQDLIIAIRHQITIILFSILPWKQGTVAFSFRERPINETVTLRENTLNLIEKSTESVTSAEWLQSGIRTVMSRFFISSGKTQDVSTLGLTPQERKMFLFIADRERTLEEICHWSGYGDTVTMKSVHYLLTRNLIDIASTTW